MSKLFISIFPSKLFDNDTSLYMQSTLTPLRTNLRCNLRQEPQIGLTLSHLIFLTRQDSQAVRARFLGYAVMGLDKFCCCCRFSFSFDGLVISVDSGFDFDFDFDLVLGLEMGKAGEEEEGLGKTFKVELLILENSLQVEW